MLCCVSKRAVAGADYGPPYDQSSSKVHSVVLEKIEVELYPAEDVPPVLLPCAICARTFMPQSLEKHSKICEQAHKKRKPFDSAKQRIQGTELAEFLPKQEKKRHYQDDRFSKPKSSWKQNHDDFLRAIRAARNEVVEPPTQRQCSSLVSSGAPTRANEQGMCPTCNRHFGIKAYDRHVAWCKERATRVHVSPATNIAKERLDARMKYRAPALKNRRPTNREKYSPGSAIALSAASKTLPALAAPKPRESLSVPSCNRSNDSPVKQKPAVVRRPGQVKESSSPSGPMKSRPIDRTNRPVGDETRPHTLPAKRNFHFSVPPLKPKKEYSGAHKSHVETIRNTGERMQQESVICPIKRGENKSQTSHSARSQRQSIVSARSQGNPKVNDVTVNAEVVGMVVQPCVIYKESELTTWKQITREAIQQPCDNINTVEAESLYRNVHLIRSNNKTINKLSQDKCNLQKARTTIDQNATGKLESYTGDISTSASNAMRGLNETYLIGDLIENESDDVMVLLNRKSKLVKHSPRVEFYLKSPKAPSSKTAPFYFGNLTTHKSGKQPNSSARKECSVEEVTAVPKPVENSCKLKSSQTCIEPSEIVQKSNDEHLFSNPNISNTKHTIENNGATLEEETTTSTEQTKLSELASQLEENPGSFTSLHVLNKSEGKDCNGNELTFFNDEALDCFKESMNQLKVSSLEVRQNSGPSSYESDSLTNDKCKINSPTMNVNPEHSLSFIEMKSDAYLTEDDVIIRPNRSSTPLNDKSEFCTSPMKGEELSESSTDPHATPTKCKWENIADEEAERVSQTESNDVNNFNASLFSEENLFETFNHLEVASASERPKSIEHLNVPSETASAITQEKEVEVEGQEELRRPPWKDDTDQQDLQAHSRRKHRISCESLKEKHLLKRRRTEDTFFEDQNVAKVEIHEEGKCEEEQQDSVDDFNDSENGMNDSMGPTIDVDTTADEEVRDIYESFVNENFQYDSYNTVDGHLTSGMETNLEFTPAQSHTVEETDRQLFTLVKTKNPVKPEKCVRNVRTPYSEMGSKIRQNMNLLRNSTDSLVSSVETTDFSCNIRAIDSIEVETIEEIGTRNKTVKYKVLPAIKGVSFEMRRACAKKEKINSESYWKKITSNRLICLDPPCQEESRHSKRNPKVRILPPVPSNPSYRKLSGALKEYDPFLLAEQQMNDLLSDTSDQSAVDSLPAHQTHDKLFPLSPSSAFVKYPYQISSPNKRSSLIAPPSEFDDLTSDFSSDSTETNSLSREVFLRELKSTKDASTALPRTVEHKSPSRELGRKVIIDKSKALGNQSVLDDHASRAGRVLVGGTDRARRILEKVSPKVVRPTVNRSHSVRASSAPKSTPERKTASSNVNVPKKASHAKSNELNRSANASLNNKNNNYVSLTGSNLSLSSIVSSEVDIKQSNSVFDEIMTSFEDENGSFPSLKSLLKNESLSLSSPIHGSRQRNGLASDEELSSPESYKRHDHGKFSADSAYSSLNRKYSNHGRSTNDVVGRLEENVPKGERRDSEAISPTAAKGKMSKFCHECGSKFPETAKFCCECGIRRLAL